MCEHLFVEACRNRAARGHGETLVYSHVSADPARDRATALSWRCKGRFSRCEIGATVFVFYCTYTGGAKLFFQIGLPVSDHSNWFARITLRGRRNQETLAVGGDIPPASYGAEQPRDFLHFEIAAFHFHLG